MAEISEAGPGGQPVSRVGMRRLVDVTIVERVVAKLMEIDRRTGIDRTLAIGELVLTEFFGGQPAAWRDRRRNKNNSIRRLAERSECPFSRSALNEAVGVYVAVQGTPIVRTFGHVCASHIASVLPLPVIERHQMLERAERERWSVRELRQNVVRLRRIDGERRGRPCADPDVKTLAALRDGLRQVHVALSRMEASGRAGQGLTSALQPLASDSARLSARIAALAAPPSPPRTIQEADVSLRKRTA